MGRAGQEGMVWFIDSIFTGSLQVYEAPDIQF